MKKFLSAVLALALAVPALAYNPAIRDIDIKVSLSVDGSALVTEVWDVVVASGTEWYLVRENLGDIDISDLSVIDGDGSPFVNEGSWDVNRSLAQKAGRCGLHKTSGGYEICWGVGSYGPHVFTVSYKMTNVVKTLTDYDMLHMQFVTDELSSAPQHVCLTLRAPVALDHNNSNIWGFGYEGTIDWEADGTVVAESDGSFDKYSSLILLLRFDKGIFQSPSIQDRDFDAVLARAMEGNTYEDEEETDTFSDILAYLFTGLVMWFIFVKPFIKGIRPGLSWREKRKRRKQIFGVPVLPSDPGWTRDLPFSGNVLETYYVASHSSGDDDKKFNIVSAFILRMMQHGVIQMRTGSAGKKEFTFAPTPDLSYMSASEKSFYDMIKTASGSDEVLQEKEFNKWAFSNTSRVDSFVSGLRKDVLNQFSGDHLLAKSGGKYQSMVLNADGQARAFDAMRFRKFLKDFTIINERYPGEVALWGEYLIMAAVFGIADQVASEMKAIAPQITLGSVALSTGSMNDLIVFSDTFRSNLSRSYSYSASRSTYSGSYGRGSSGGFGGSSSFGGGGGFSGGGHGGGSR